MNKNNENNLHPLVSYAKNQFNEEKQEIKITDEISQDSLNNVEKLLELIRFFDEGRWASGYNYDIPNYADKDMTLEQKWLTHFLGYITDRQTSYSLIFSKLDFIFSQLVVDYQHSSGDYLLLHPGPYFDEEKKKFTARHLLDERAQYASDKLLPRTELITAASRFYPTDLVAIFCTLKLLNCFSENNLSNYMNLFLKRAPEGRELESLLYGLWLLGYSDIGQWKIEEVNNQAIDERCFIPKKEAIERFLYENNKCLQKHGEIPEEFREKRFHIKRLTCFLRDLLKCDHFLDREGKFINLEMRKKLQKQLHMLELPGDVWNNNEHFQECFFLNSGIEHKKTSSFNKVVREFYEKYAWQKLGLSSTNYYPEQFDTTFDFVPRMCEKTGQINCSFCPLKRSDGKIPKEFCLEKSDEAKYCPFLLYACGYKVCCKVIKSCPNKH